MHYHIDAWIWTSKLAVQRKPESDVLKKFLAHREQQKADGTVFFGMSLNPDIPLADDMKQLITNLDAWTAGHRVGLIEGIKVADRKVKEALIEKWVNELKEQDISYVELHPVPESLEINGNTVKTVLAIIDGIESGRCVVSDASIDTDDDDHGRRIAYD